MRVEFSLSLEPVAKARPRVTVNPKTGKPLVYTPKKTAQFEGKVASMAQPSFKEPLRGPVRLEIMFFLPRPGRLMRKSDPECEVPHVGRPDLDNLEKAVIDGLNGVAFVDDRQVYAKRSEKLYHAKGGYPHLKIIVEDLPP